MKHAPRLNALIGLVVVFALTLPTLALAGPRLYSGREFTGENPLGVDRALFARTQDGLELLYLRRYDESLQVFERIGVDYPESPVQHVGRAVVYQARMFENMDYANERQYLQEYAEAERLFRALGRRPADKAWIFFLKAVHIGVDAMYLVRHREYVAGLNKAWDALALMQKVQKIEPKFKDPEFALGLYNFWRTAITQQADYLPSFGDHKAEGLAQMLRARDEGLLAQAPAGLALAYSYMEDKDWAKATETIQWVQARYPHNVISEMTAGRIHRLAKRYDEAEDVLLGITKFAPDNDRVWFHIGETRYRSRKKNKSAFEAYERYLASDPLPEYKSHTYYRMGLVKRRLRQYDDAIAMLQKAVDLNPKFKRAGKKLAQVKEEKERRAQRRQKKKANARPAKTEGTTDKPKATRAVPRTGG
jgi:tetratricopeptide (TPR) repeat protein